MREDGSRNVGDPIEPGSRLRRRLARALGGDFAAGFRLVAGTPLRCPACSNPATSRRICAACRDEPNRGSAPWRVRTLRIDSLGTTLPVRCFGSYESAAGSGRCRLADLLAAFKYGRRRDAGRALADLLRRHPPRPPRRPDAVVPVPLAPGALRRRGFNQAAWFARAIARTIPAPVEPDALRRVAEAAPQAGRSRSQRQRRSSPFQTHRARGLRRARILLVDDVCTTGTTLAQAAEALLCAGALHVECAVLLNSNRRVSP